MKIRNILLVAIAVHVVCLSPAKAQKNSPEGYYASLHGAFDFTASNHPPLVEDGFFAFNLTGFAMVGTDVGKYKGKESFLLSIYRGFAILPESIEDSGVEPYDKETELQKSFTLGFTYRKQASKIKHTNKIKVNFGGRVTAMVRRYSGVKAFLNDDSKGSATTYTLKDFRMTTGGVEAAPYLEVGKQTPGGNGVFLNWELFYFRVGYQHAALGLQKVSLIFKF